MVVLVSLATCGWIKGYLVLGHRIGEALLQQAGDIVAGAESKTAAPDGKHLEPQIPRVDLARLGNAF